MRAICYTMPGVKLFDLPEPQIREPDEVKVRIAYAGICGSDIHLVKGERDAVLKARFRPGEPQPFGHEGVGYVAELGPRATAKGLKVGDKVVLFYKHHCGKCHYCRSGKENFCQNEDMRETVMSDYVVYNEEQVFKLPDDADLKRAALIEPISTTLHGIDRCHIRVGSSVLISGGGAIGSLMAQLARLSGAVRLTVSDPVPEKRQTALRLGADFVIDPFAENLAARAKEITEGLGFDVVIETSGSDKAIRACYDALGNGGTLELFAGYHPDATLSMLSLSPFEFMMKEPVIVGVRQSPYMYPRSIEAYTRLNLTPYIENIFRPEDCEAAFAAQMSGKPQKVLFDFQQYTDERLEGHNNG